MAPSDAQLIQRVRADETGEAMRALYRTYSGELFGFALNALGERGAAEELVQEVFTRAWRHAESYDPSRGSVRTWLYQIARNAIIDARRRASVRPGARAARALRERRGRSCRRSSRPCWAGRSSARSSGSARAPPGDPARPLPGAEHARDRRALRAPVGTVKSRTWYALRSLRLVLEEMGVR